MDPSDAEAWRADRVAIGRELGARRKIWALLLTHTLLTGVCLACSFYILQRPSTSSSDKGIFLNMQKLKDQDTHKLHFTVSWNQSLELYEGSEVKVHYPGPYIFYICATVDGDNGAKGNLTLKQGKTQTSIELQAQELNSKRCVRHERLVSLYESEVVTFIYHKTDYMDLKILRVGLHYMLGDQKFETTNEEV